MSIMASVTSTPMAPEGNLSRYLQDIRKFPMLAPEEELRLAKLWRNNEDSEAAHKLVTSHLRLSPRSRWAIAAMVSRSAN